MAQEQTNGNKSWQTWVIGILSTTTFVFFSLYINLLSADVKALEQAQATVSQTVNVHSVQIESAIQQTKMLNEKLDQLLEDMRETRDAVIRNGR